MADDKTPDNNARIFDFQIHHIIPISLWRNTAIEDVLMLLPIEQESRGNNIGLLVTD